MIIKDNVKKAIHMNGPDRVPILFFNKDKEQSDIIIIDVIRHFLGENRDVSEWGFTWKHVDETMGQPRSPIIGTWSDLDSIVVPDAFDETRYSHISEVIEQYGQRYYLASLVLSGFSLMTLLRGFENTLEDFYTNADEIGKLADIVFQFEETVISQLDNYRVDAIGFYDDWGTQNNLIISPELWRSFFKPRYKKQFDLAHGYGLDVYFHSCGNISSIIPDLIEIGVDMLNISQPNLYDIAKLGHEYGGKTCFVCPISYQTTSISGSKEDIYNEAKLLVDSLGSFNGGFIGYVEEYHSVGMTTENYSHCVNAFKEYGVY